MATVTTYSKFPVPEDGDPLRDGAAAIRALGEALDPSVSFGTTAPGQAGNLAPATYDVGNFPTSGSNANFTALASGLRILNPGRYAIHVTATMQTTTAATSSVSVVHSTAGVYAGTQMASPNGQTRNFAFIALFCVANVNIGVRLYNNTTHVFQGATLRIFRMA